MTTHATGWHRHKGSWPGEVWPDEGCRRPDEAREPVLVVDPTAARDVIARALLEADHEKAWGQTKTPNGKYLRYAEAVLAALEATP